MLPGFVKHVGSTVVVAMVDRRTVFGSAIGVNQQHTISGWNHWYLPLVTSGEAGALVLVVRLDIVVVMLGIVGVSLEVRLVEDEEEVASVPPPYAESPGLVGVDPVLVASADVAVPEEIIGLDNAELVRASLVEVVGL